MDNQHPETDASVDSNESTTTHFGFQQVDKDKKAGLVGQVFTSVASRYDIMNDLMSAGIHRLWKRFTIEVSAVRQGHRVLDLAGGTGDLAAKLSRLVGDEGEVILSDINQSMLATGRDKQTDLGNTDNISYVLGDAQYLPFQSDYFDCVTIGFGLRNVTDKDLALRSILRVLKSGGRLLVLEFSTPTNPLLSKIYDGYSFKLLPKIGKLIAQDEESYRYLAESIRMHPDQETLNDMLEDAGFVNCEYHNMTGGIVAVHKGIKA